jgi:16S rRNA (guanine966-N2)-methyltransferase
MRVITGEARGRKLKTLEGTEVIRPTTDRVKEGLFSALQFDLPGARFLDLFAGSGQIGIEALSRGASFAMFTDESKRAVSVICDNLKATGFSPKAKVLLTDAKLFLASTAETFDIAFLDPPYHQGLLPEFLPLVAKKMAPDGIIFCEHERGEEVPEEFSDFYLKKQYRYGKLMLSKYLRKPKEDNA